MDRNAVAEMLGVAEISEEQWESFDKLYNSEVDKARTQASKTAAANAKKQAVLDAEASLDVKASAKAQELLTSLMQTEEEKLQAQLAEGQKLLDADRNALNLEKREMAASAKLKANGYEGDTLSALVELFSVKPSVEECETAVDSFLESANKAIEAKVDAVKEELTKGGASPNLGKGGTTAASADEGKILTDIYARAKEDGFVNNRNSNMGLDVAALMALEANSAKSATN